MRIAELDEMSYRRNLWSHRPLTDFWRVGPGYARKLEEHGMLTMGDVALCSVGKPSDYHNEELLYKLFGVNAELLIDHAWGWEPCTIADIKAYRPESRSVGGGQVLTCPYTVERARLVVQEMAEETALSLVDKGLAADQIVLTVGYDIENLKDGERRKKYRGEVTKDGMDAPSLSTATGQKISGFSHPPPTRFVRRPCGSTTGLQTKIFWCGGSPCLPAMWSGRRM